MLVELGSLAETAGLVLRWAGWLGWSAGLAESGMAGWVAHGACAHARVHACMRNRVPGGCLAWADPDPAQPSPAPKQLNKLSFRVPRFSPHKKRTEPAGPHLGSCGRGGKTTKSDEIPIPRMGAPCSFLLKSATLL